MVPTGWLGIELGAQATAAALVAEVQYRWSPCRDFRAYKSF